LSVPLLDLYEHDEQAVESFSQDGVA
jgi:hypothetical protein